MRKAKPTVFLLAYLLLASPFIHAATGIEIDQPWISEAPPTVKVLAGYARIVNSTDKPLILQQVSSPAFESVEIHRSVIENGTATMQQQSSITIAAGSTFEFKPGDYHLMLFEPVTPIKAGKSVKLEFIFTDSVSIVADAVVRKLQHHQDIDHQHHH